MTIASWTCEACPIRRLETNPTLISDYIQIFAARRAGEYALRADSAETPIEAAESLSKHYLDDQAEGFLGGFDVVRRSQYLAAGVKCAKLFLEGQCRDGVKDWHRANDENDPNAFGFY
mgnify:CR=1 FL=1